VLLYPRGTR